MGETKSKKKTSPGSKKKAKPSKWVQFMTKRMHEMSEDPEWKGVSHKDKMTEIGADWKESDENPKNKKGTDKEEESE